MSLILDVDSDTIQEYFTSSILNKDKDYNADEDYNKEPEAKGGDLNENREGDFDGDICCVCLISNNKGCKAVNIMKAIERDKPCNCSYFICDECWDKIDYCLICRKSFSNPPSLHINIDRGEDDENGEIHIVNLPIIHIQNNIRSEHHRVILRCSLLILLIVALIFLGSWINIK